MDRSPFASPLYEDDRQLTAMAHIMDQFNGTFGDSAVFLGGMHGAEEDIPTRFAFNHIPDLSTQELAELDEELRAKDGTSPFVLTDRSAGASRTRRNSQPKVSCPRFPKSGGKSR